MAVRAHGNEGPAPLSNHASHFRLVEARITSPLQIKVLLDGMGPSFSYQPISFCISCKSDIQRDAVRAVGTVVGRMSI